MSDKMSHIIDLFVSKIVQNVNLIFTATKQPYHCGFTIYWRYIRQAADLIGRFGPYPFAREYSGLNTQCTRHRSCARKTGKYVQNTFSMCSNKVFMCPNEFGTPISVLHIVHLYIVETKF